MTKKRFFILKDEQDPTDKDCWCIRDRTFKIKDIYGHYKYDNLEEICRELNALHEENQQLKEYVENLVNKDAYWEKKARQRIQELENELHLTHIRAMFSTVKSFKGDISKRFTYNEETDTIYDTANHHGQYNKILDKKEATMLLNELNTILKEQDDTISKQKKLICNYDMENGMLLDEIKNLKKGKQTIKNTIKTMMETERTQIGKNTLRELWDRIQ